MSEAAAIERSSLPGDGGMKPINVGGVQVAVANIGGIFYAFGDTCTHRQCSLSEGELDGTKVTCPCHGSQFDVTTGEVLRGPAEDPVGSHAVTLEGEFLRVQA